MASRSVHSATAERNLRSGISVWQDSTHANVAARPLTRSLKADVVIVGAGISGAFMAHALAGQFETVVVVDRRPPLHGSTMASTAMLQFEIDVPLIKLAEQIGWTKAARAWRRSWTATRELKRLIVEEGIHCGYQPRGALYLSGNELGHRALIKEQRARKRAGIDGRYLDAAALKEKFGIDREGAIESGDSASANPVQLAARLLRRSGAAVYSPVEIRDYLATPHGVVLDTGEHFIEARHAVFCTGYELLKGIPRKGVKITSSWAIASRPHAHYPAWLNDMLIWEASDPYLYLRTTPDRRLIIGGEDEEVDVPSHRARVIPRKTAALERKLRKLLPDVDFTLGKEWAGAFGESVDGLPIIDEVPDMPNCHTVMGIGGNGTIYSFIAAQILSRRLKGRQDKDSDLYRFR
jgi:glycine/D-amino acid oxidase-like deaminating enzyme